MRSARGSSCSLRDEGQPVLADLQLVPVLELRRVDALAVQERAVQAALVLDPEAAVVVADEHRVLARHRDVVEEDVAVGRASDGRLRLRRVEALPRPAAGAHYECRCLEPLEPDPGGLRELLGRHGLRLPRRRILRADQRATAGAVARRLRIREAAFGTVDLRHAVSASSGGGPFAVRMSVSVSTSTASRTLFPPDFCRRATSSARRMSIFPCRSRRLYETSCSSFTSDRISSFSSASDRVAKSGSGSTCDLSSRAG